jgi:hypothetical protein
VESSYVQLKVPAAGKKLAPAFYYPDLPHVRFQFNAAMFANDHPEFIFPV